MKAAQRSIIKRGAAVSFFPPVCYTVEKDNGGIAMKIDRMMGIVTILLKQDKITAPELARRFEVSRRTINRDIEDICRAGIPIVTTQGYGGGVSIAEGFKLDKSLLTGDELQAILSGVKGLDSVSAEPHFPTLAEKLPGGSSDDILIDLASHYQGPLTEKIAAIQAAIQNRLPLSFDYYYEKGQCRRAIEPYKLVFRWSAWYVWGWCPERQAFRLFKLNRLWNLEQGAEPFETREFPPEEMDFDRHFSARTYRLKALFAESERYRLVEEYGPDCYRETPNGLLLERDFASCSNMREWVLSFGGQAEVLEPKDLRTELLRQAEAMLKKYRGT